MNKIPKKWRELPIKERLNIPEKYFNIDTKTIERIRQIQDPKKRLIEAASVQYELFKDIHSYLTVWIAGYGSDVMVRNYFESTKNLLEQFMSFPKINKKINPSWADIKRKIKTPEEMTETLAEETGIHIGDGNLYVNTNKAGSKSYNYNISGDLTDEYLYHTEHIAKIMKDLYNIGGWFLERVNKNSIESRYKSKTIVEFKNKILNLPIGPKKNIEIPKDILSNNEYMKKCIIGIIDTDFSVTSSFAISGKINNLLVTKEIHKFFNKNKIKHIYRLYEDYSRFYINKSEAIKIITDWHLNNPKHISKYRVFQEFKKYFPYTTTPERLALLDGKMDLNDLARISKKRSDQNKLN